MEIRIKVTNSSHPNFRYFATTTNTRFVVAKRFDTLTDTDAWIETLRSKAYDQGHTLVADYDL